MSSDLEEGILKSLRRITRAIDLHSRYLANKFGLTGPQLVCLRSIARSPGLTASRLADEVALSQATITGIVDRLVARQLVERSRSEEDRRVVTMCITDAGAALIKTAPSPLQEKFARALAELPADEQTGICDTLARIVEMMGGGEIEAAPILSTSPAALSAEEISESVDPGPPDVVPLSSGPGETPAIDEPSSNE